MSWIFNLSYFALKFVNLLHRHQATLTDFLVIEMRIFHFSNSVFQKMMMRA